MSCLPQPSQLAFAVAAHVASYIHRLDVYPNCQISLQEIAPEPTPYSSLDGVSWSIYPDTNPAFTNLTTTLVGTTQFGDVVWGAIKYGWQEPQYDYGKGVKRVFVSQISTIFFSHPQQKMAMFISVVCFNRVAISFLIVLCWAFYLATCVPLTLSTSLLLLMAMISGEEGVGCGEGRSLTSSCLS